MMRVESQQYYLKKTEKITKKDNFNTIKIL